MSLKVSPSANPLENHRPRRHRKHQRKPHSTLVLTNAMRTQNLLILKRKGKQLWRSGPKRCSQKARSQRPTVFPAKTQKVRSHQGKILDSSKDHRKGRSTHHKKKRDVKLPKPSRTTLTNWCRKGWSCSYTGTTAMNRQIYQFLYRQKRHSRDWNAKFLRPPEYRPAISSWFWRGKSGRWRSRKRFASAGLITWWPSLKGKIFKQWVCGTKFECIKYKIITRFFGHWSL